jgi:hypothetical protein
VLEFLDGGGESTNSGCCSGELDPESGGAFEGTVGEGAAGASWPDTEPMGTKASARVATSNLCFMMVSMRRVLEFHEQRQMPKTRSARESRQRRSLPGSAGAGDSD